MDVTKGNISNIFNAQIQYIVPLYQRMYSWKNEQCKRLWDDIVGLEKKHKNGHFIGSIVSVVESAPIAGTPKHLVIDGQQRLTTLTILLIALRDFLNSQGKANSINERYLKNLTDDENDRYKLVLTYNDKETLIKLIDKSPIDNIKNSRIIDVYNFFLDKITSNTLTQEKITDAISKLQIVGITLDASSDDPQSVFESLNSTGLDLSQSDLIRNFVLMGLSRDDQAKIYKNIWLPTEKLFDYDKQSDFMDAFFRDYITMKIARIPKIGEVYQEFKKLYSQINVSQENLCNDIYCNAKNYVNMIFSKSDDVELNSLFSDIKLLKMEVAYPFLMYVYNDYVNTLITRDDFISILKMTESYVLRRAICEIPTNSMNKTFASFKNKIKKEQYLDSIKAHFVLLDTYTAFPKDEEFVQHFIEKDIYNMRIRNYILGKLERFDNKEKLDLFTFTNTFTIEHVMPETENLRPEWRASLGKNWKEIHAKYLHTIGNLTLTAYNSEMSDRPFADKLTIKGGFLDTGLRLNSYIRNQKEWNLDKINERAQILAKNALKIWEYPDVSSIDIQQYVPNKDKKKEIYGLDHHLSSFSNETLSLYEELDKRIMNLDSSIKKEFMKPYIAYKYDTNFVDIIPRKGALVLSINMGFDKIYDPKGICENNTGKGRLGNGEVGIHIINREDLDYVMPIIEQSLNLQLDS